MSSITQFLRLSLFISVFIFLALACAIAGFRGWSRTTAQEAPAINAGDLDATFGASGKVITDFDGRADTIYALARQTDSKLVAVGSTNRSNNFRAFALARYNADGSLDTAFGTGGKVVTDFDQGATPYSAEAQDVKIQSDGKIVTVGYATITGSAFLVVARYLSDGQLDSSFDGDGKIAVKFDNANSLGYAVGLTADSNIVVAGAVATATSDDFLLAQYKPDGTLDASFGNGGRVTTDFTNLDRALALVVQADGKIVLGGLRNSSLSALARYTANGALDTTFGNAGRVSEDTSAIRDLALQPDGRVVAVTTTTLGRYETNGTPDAGFGINGKIALPSPQSGLDVALQANGRLAVSSTSNGDFTIDMFLPDGGRDVTFGTGGRVRTQLGASGSINDLLIQPDGKIVAAGNSDFFGSTTSNFGLARFFGAGDCSFSINPNRQAFVAAGGQSATVNISAPSGCAWSSVSNSGFIALTSGFTGTGNGTVTFSVSANTATFARSGTLTIANQPFTVFQLGTSALSGAGALDLGFDFDGFVLTDFAGGNDEGNALAVQPDGKMILVGTATGGIVTAAVVRYLADGNIDASFGLNGKVFLDFGGGASAANAVALQPDGKIVVVGTSGNVTNGANFAVARLLSNGALDNTFGTGGKTVTDFAGTDLAFAVALQSDGKVIAAGSSASDFALARYTANGAPDASFGTNGGRLLLDINSTTDEARALAITGEGKILVTGRANSGFGALVRLQTNGALDSSFGTGGKVSLTNSEGRDLLLQPNGRILIAGYGSGFSSPTIYRFLSEGQPDPSFGLAGRTIVPATNNLSPSGSINLFLALQADDKILVGGTCGSFPSDFCVVRLNSIGEADAGFGTAGLSVIDAGGNERVSDLAVLANGNIILAGTRVDSTTSQGDFALARLLGGANCTYAVTPANLAFTAVGGTGVVNITAPAGCAWTASSSASFVTFTGSTSGAGSGTVNFSVAANPSGSSARTSVINVSGQNINVLQLSPSALTSGAGSSDLSFDFDGVVTTNFHATSNDQGYALAQQPDGKLILAGSASNSLGSYFAAARYNPDGTLDTSFGTGGKVVTDFLNQADARAIALQPDGKIILAGRTAPDTFSSNNRIALLRYLPNGDLDTGFGTAGKVITNVNDQAVSASAVALQPDGKIVVAGTYNTTNFNASDFIVLRYNADGSTDTSFSGGRVLTDFTNTNDRANALVILPDGKIVAAGDTATGSFTSTAALARYNPNGTLDNTFGTGGKVTTTASGSNSGLTVSDLALQADGKFIAGIGTDIIRYLPNGSFDPTFGIGGRVRLNSITAVALEFQADGKILVLGISLIGSNSTLARLAPNGDIDTGFGVNGIATLASNGVATYRGLVIQSNGTIMVGGNISFNNQPTGTDFALARVNNGIGCTYSISPNGVQLPDTAAAGQFTVNTNPGCAWSVSTANANFVTIQSGAAGVGSGVVNFTVPVNDGGVRGGRLTVAGQTFFVDQRSRFRLANASGFLDPTFDSDGRIFTSFLSYSNEQANAVLIQPDGRIIAAGFVEGGFNRDFALARYNPDGSLDNTFGLNGRVITDFNGLNDEILSLEQQADGKILAAGYAFSPTASSSESDFAVARYNTDGSLDTTFGAGGRVVIEMGQVASVPNDSARKVLLQSDGKIILVGIAIVNIGPQTDFALTRLNPDGTPDNSFGTNSKVYTDFTNDSDGANSALLLGNDKIVAVGFAAGGRTQQALARYNADGSLDATFGTGGRVLRGTSGGSTTFIGGATDVALQSDGKLLVGAFPVESLVTPGITRYNDNGSLDTAFAALGLASAAAGTLRLQADGKILFAGSGLVGRLNINGSTDNGFLWNNFSNVVTEARALGIQPDGRIIVAGYFSPDTANPNLSDFAVARLYNGEADGPILEGRLKDNFGRALSGQPISVSGFTSKVLLTDATGRYFFSDLKAGGDYALKPGGVTHLFNPMRRDFVNLGSSFFDIQFPNVANGVPPPVVPLTDNFDSAARNSEKWSIGGLTRADNSIDTSFDVATQTNGQLVIPQSANVTTPRFNGYTSAGVLDLTNGAASVELVQAANGGAETGFALGMGPEYYYRFAVLPANANPSRPDGGNGSANPNAPAAESSLLVMQMRSAGQFRILSVPYNPTAHRFLRLRHIPETLPASAANASPGGYIAFETSPAGSPLNYTELYRVAVGPRSVAYLLAELSAGATNPLATPGTAIFDNFAAGSNSAAQFMTSAATVSEGDGQITVTVSRTGDSSGTASVEYATAGGTAQSGSRYIYTAGTLNFAANETSKNITVPLIDNLLVDGTQTTEITLSNPRGVSLNSPARVIVTITDNDVAGANNPIEDSQFFVRQQYYDFLNRAPDQAGLDYWTGQITTCGTNTACIRDRRIAVSAAFFVELEFQSTGYVVYRFYRAAFGPMDAPNQTRANILYDEFSSDRAQLVGGPQLEQSTRALADLFVQRERFTEAYPLYLSNEQFVNRLFDKAGLVPFTTERQAEIAAMNTAGRTRAQVLLNVINNTAFQQREYNPSFVLMQYFGYLRRNPDQAGYDFWLGVLNQQPQNFRGMVCAFITSAEYQLRFGTQTPRTNQECN